MPDVEEFCVQRGGHYCRAASAGRQAALTWRPVSEFPDPEQDWGHALLMRKSTGTMFTVRPDDAGRPHDDGICYCAECLEVSRDDLLFLLVPEPPKETPALRSGSEVYADTVDSLGWLPGSTKEGT